MARMHVASRTSMMSFLLFLLYPKGAMPPFHHPFCTRWYILSFILSTGISRPDWNSALMLVAAMLRHVAGTKWESVMCLKMGRLESQPLEEVMAG
jgi:hypothetical protein